MLRISVLLLTLALAMPAGALATTSDNSSGSGGGLASAAKKKKCKKKKAAAAAKKCKRKRKTPAPTSPGSPGATPQPSTPPTVSIGDVSTAYPSLNSATMEFQVLLSAPSSSPVSVDYSSGAGGDAAVAGEDYDSVTGTLNFAPGSTSAPIPVTVLPAPFNTSLGSGAEPAESFTITLSSPVNATLADGQATGTITTEDESPCPDETVTPPFDLDNNAPRYGNLCLGDTGDSYPYSFGGDGAHLWRVTLVPMNTDDDPELSVMSGFASGGTGVQGPGETETVEFTTLFMNSSTTIQVIHAGDRTPARAEGYVIYAGQVS